MSAASRTVPVATTRSSGARTKRRGRTVGLMAVLILCGVGVALLIRALAPASPVSPVSEQTVLRINGQAVPVREFLQFVADDRAATIGYFQQHYGANVDSNFWSESFGNTTPRAYLIRAAVMDATRFVVQVEEAEKLKTVVGFTYPGFLNSWNAENARRAQDLAAGKVIYGPQQYTEANYFQTISGTISSTLEQKLDSAGIVTVTDDTLHRYYQSHLADYPASRAAPTTLGPEPAGPAQPFTAVQAQVKQACTDLAFKKWIERQVDKSTVSQSADAIAAIPIS